MNRVDDSQLPPKSQPGSGATAESDGWFTVARAAQLLGLAIPRVFDRIRDGKLQVRFETTRPGEADRPFVTSPELKVKAAAETGTQNGAGAGAAAGGAVAPSPAPVTTSGALPAAAAAPNRPAPDPALLEEARRVQHRLEAELRETRETATALETQLDTALRTIYERDVKIARLEAEAGAQSKMREEGDHFIRHLESRLDRQETRNEEKEKEIRRLAVGIGEAHSEIRLLKPPPPEPPKLWHKVLQRTALLAGVAGGGFLFFWIAWQLALKTLTREAGLTAGAGVLLAFSVGWFVDRLRRSK
jgi:hypothetical protein